MNVTDLISKLEALDGNLKVDILIKPINGQMALAAIREPWDDDILIFETAR